MSGLFVQYDDEFNDGRDEAAQLISKLSTYSGTEGEEACRSASRKLDELDSIVHMMKQQARSADEKRIVSEDLEEIKKLRALVSGAQKQQQEDYRARLLEGRTRSDLNSGKDERERMENASQKLKNTTNYIDEALTIGLDTVEVASGALGELNKQRDQMERGRGRVRNINDNLSRAGLIMRGMARRIMTNKLISAVIILFLLAAIGLVIYFMVA